MSKFKAKLKLEADEEMDRFLDALLHANATVIEKKPSKLANTITVIVECADEFPYPSEELKDV